jgi:hypothetical protein
MAAMRALLTAIIYCESFLLIGMVVKLAVNRLSRDTDLSDIQSQAGAKRRKQKAFLLGAWRSED